MYDLRNLNTTLLAPVRPCTWPCTWLRTDSLTRCLRSPRKFYFSSRFRGHPCCSNEGARKLQRLNLALSQVAIRISCNQRQWYLRCPQIGFSLSCSRLTPATHVVYVCGQFAESLSPAKSRAPPYPCADGDHLELASLVSSCSSSSRIRRRAMSRTIALLTREWPPVSPPECSCSGAASYGRNWRS